MPHPGLNLSFHFHLDLSGCVSIRFLMACKRLLQPVRNKHLPKMNISDFQSNVKDYDFFNGIFANSSLRAYLAIIYALTGFCVIGLARVACFERSGKAGHFRTLVNQLMSFNLDQMVLFFVFPMTLDALRTFIGPLPRIVCQANVVAKNILQLNVSQITLAITVIKFSFVCIFKSIPIMEDKLLSIFAYMIINIISILATLARFYLPGKPLLNELICTGIFYDQWIDEAKPINSITYIPIGCFLLHLILSIPIWIIQFKWNKDEPESNSFNFGSFKTSWVVLSLMLISTLSVAFLNGTHPPLLNEYPNNLIVAFVYFVMPLSFAVGLCFLYYPKNKKLQKYFSFLFFRSAEDPIYTVPV